MNASFGPWSTAMHTPSSLQIRGFWRKRLLLLLAASRTSPALSRSARTWLLLACAGTLALPTFLAGTAEEGKGNADSKAIGEFKGLFALAEAEVLKCVLPPFSPNRMVYYRHEHDTQAKAIPEGPNAMMFRWREGKLVHWGMSFGGPDLPTLLRILKDFFPQEIEGDPELLKSKIQGDWVVREDAPAEKVIAQLEEILRRDHKLPLKLALRDAERKVIVARGKFRFTPVPGRPPAQIEIYSRELTDPARGGGGSGDFASLLNWVGMYIHRRVISEVAEPPKENLTWHYNRRQTKDEKDEKDEARVLEHLSEQTGLTFGEELRRVRVLAVERAD